MNAMRSALVALALLAAPAALAHADAVDLAWDTCEITSGSGTLVWNCDANLPDVRHRLAMAFRTDWDMPDLIDVRIVLVVATQSLTTPDWWRFGPGECRDGAFTFPAYMTGLGPTCAVPWAAQGTGGAYTVSYASGHVGQARITMDIGTAEPIAIQSGVRYLAAAASFDLGRTVADGSGDPVCAGCSDVACLVVESIDLIGASVQYRIYNVEGRQQVHWQTLLGGGDPCWVATRRATWGGIKTLYR